MTLKTVKASTLEPRCISVMIFGGPGIGKTTLIGMLPGKTLLVDCDVRGAVVLRNCPNVDVYRLTGGLRDAYYVLGELAHECPYDNVAFDSLSSLEFMELCRRGYQGNNGGQASQKDYGEVYGYIKNYCVEAIKLPANTIFTAHEKPLIITDFDGRQNVKVIPKIGDKTGNIATEICGLCDVVGRCSTYITQEGKQERYVSLEASPTSNLKDRIWGRRGCRYEELILKHDRVDVQRQGEEDLGSGA